MPGRDTSRHLHIPLSPAHTQNCSKKKILEQIFPDTFCLMVHHLHSSRVSARLSRLTRVDPEEAGGAAKVLPGQRGILLEVVDEDVVERLRVVDGVEDVWV